MHRLVHRYVLALAVSVLPAEVRGLQDSRARLAVLELTGGPGVDRQLLAAMSDRIRAVASREVGRRFAIVTRENAAAILRDLGRPCPEGDDSACEVDSGRELQAAVVITGNVRIIDSLHVVELRAFATRDGRLLGARHAEARRKVDLLKETRAATMELLQEALSQPDDTHSVAESPSAKQPASGLLPSPTTRLPGARGLSDQVAMVRIPGGTYWASSPSGRAGSIPGRWVNVQPFLIDDTEVPVRMYAACAQQGTCAMPRSGQSCTYGVIGKEAHPQNCVTWGQAEVYCRWAHKRLPTEAEWEWAARGATRLLRSPWGFVPPSKQLCWSAPGNDRATRGFAATCAVGSYPAGGSPQGVKDLAGGVEEWTATRAGSGHVIRGGSWATTSPKLALASWRLGGDLDVSPAIGFRCARGLGP